MNKKKILVVSDNSFLCKALNSLIDELKIIDYQFDYAISPNSRIEEFHPIQVSCIDLRDSSIVQNIIENYFLVISIHCKQLFPFKLVENVRCVNVHPGFNPINRGWFPQVFAIAYNLPVGATIHEIDLELDHGRIIARELVEILSYDTSYTLYNRILETEIRLLKKHLISILENTYSSFEPESEGNLFFKKDFSKLCKINLEEKTTYKECINKLRALSHDDYLNAYFFDDKTGEKVFIKLELIKSS